MAARAKDIPVSTPRREVMVDITAEVESAVRELGARDGLVMVFCPHTTAAVTLNENADPDVRADLNQHLGKLVPREAGFRHAEGNSDAHIKASLVGASCLVPLAGGSLVLGTWQAIFFWEFDGPRRRRVRVQVLESA